MLGGAWTAANMTEMASVSHLASCSPGGACLVYAALVTLSWNILFFALDAFGTGTRDQLRAYTR